MEESKLKCTYTIPTINKATCRYAWTEDNVRVDYSDQWKWPHTCHNSLCGSNLYEEAAYKYNSFIAELVHEFRGVGEPVWWFRGQANTEWPVLPGVLRDDFTQSILRQFPIFHAGVEHTPKQIYYEKFLMSTFIRNGSGLVNERLNVEDWYIKAQHHGLPTRLLDWTTNPLIALWMALDNITQDDKDGVIIAMIPIVKEDKKAIVKTWNQERIEKLFRYLSEQPDTMDIEEPYRELFENEAILPFSPNFYSQRQTNQQSVFTIHTPPAINANNVSYVGINDFYECREFIVEAGLKELYKTFLFVNGMRRWNIYPDLDNLAKGLRENNILTRGNPINIKNLIIGN